VALAFVLFKSNRNLRVLLILLPVLAVNLIWSVAKTVLPFPSGVVVVLDQVFATFVAGITLLWLLADKIGNRNRFATFLFALLVMAFLAGIGIVSFGASGSSQETLVATVFLGILTAVLLLGFVLAAWCCRKRWGGVRLNLWLLLWSIGVSIAGFLVFLGILATFQTVPMPEALFQVLIMGAITGAICYVVLLPYMILAWRSDFWWARLYALLHLKSMTASRASGPTLPDPNVEDAPAEIANT
jgi:hypothetical protein